MKFDKVFAMTVYEFLNVGKLKDDNVMQKLLSKITTACDVRPAHLDDAKQEIMIKWFENTVKEEFMDSTPRVLAFAKDLGAQACFSHKRIIGGSLEIPRRVIKQHRDSGKQLVTDSVSIELVREDEVTEGANTDLSSVFRLPIQTSILPLPIIDQHMQRDLNSGESLELVLFSSGMEKRALQGKITNLVKADVSYVEDVTNEIKEQMESGFNQPFLPGFNFIS